jgi:hypothetical protein
MLKVQSRLPDALQKYGLTSDFHPTQLKLQVVSINLGMIKPARIQFQLGGTTKTFSIIPFAHEMIFDISTHSLLFYSLKVNVQIQKLLSFQKIGCSSIKLSQFDNVHGELFYTLTIRDYITKETEIGEIALKMNFLFGEFGNEDIPFVESPISSSNSSSGYSFSDRRLLHTCSEGSFGNLSELDDLRKSLEKESYFGRRTLSRSSGGSFYKKRSSKEGLRVLTGLVQSFGSTGWRISSTDIAKGVSMVLLLSDQYPTQKTFNVVDDDKFLRIGSYFMKFSMASYGAILLQYFGYGTLNDFISIAPNRKACISFLNLNPEYLLAWEYESHGIFDHKPSFFACYDESTKSIILSIRGTLGLADLLTDLNSEYVPFIGGLAHAGSFHSASWIKEHFGSKIIEWIKQHNALALYITGHSLGGSIASILLMLMKEEVHQIFGDPFEILCYTYGTPPCISHNLAAAVEPYIFTFINEYDFVPKLSYGSVQDFRELIIYGAELANNPSFSKIEKLALMKDKRQELKETNVHPRLATPGQLFLLYKTSRINSSRKSQQFNPPETGNPLIDNHEPHYVIERTTTEHFEDFEIRMNMVVNHFLRKYDIAMHKAHDWLLAHKTNRN